MYCMHRKLRSGNQALAQIVRRMAEEENVLSNQAVLQSDSSDICLSKPHATGPIIIDRSQENWNEFKVIRLKDVKITCKSPDDTVLLRDGRIVTAKNFIKSPNGTSWILETVFKNKRDLYNYPLPSSALVIYLASDFSPQLQYWHAKEIACKAVRLKIPTEKKLTQRFAIIPFIHHV